jgi:hypothetical protein
MNRRNISSVIYLEFEDAAASPAGDGHLRDVHAGATAAVPLPP